MFHLPGLIIDVIKDLDRTKKTFRFFLRLFYVYIFFFFNLKAVSFN